MIIPFDTDGYGIPYLVRNLDAASGFFHSMSVSGQQLTVALGVKVGEPVAEFDLLVFNF
jgi:hypothetical protein